MILAIYHSIVVIERRQYQMRFDDYSFSPLPSENLSRPDTLEGWRHYRVPNGKILVEAPFGSKVVTVQRPTIPPTKTSKGLPGGPEERLAVFWEPYAAPHGIDAETVVYMARNGSRGFCVASGAELAA